jgi:hypothetical protein
VVVVVVHFTLWICQVNERDGARSHLTHHYCGSDMTAHMPTFQQFHERLIADTFPQRLTDDDAFFVFAILHSYVTFLTGPVLSDAPECQKLFATTQRGAAEALTVLWHGSDDERAQSSYWYWKWNTDWEGYSHLENLSPLEKARMRNLKQRIEEHPFVARLEPEDDDPLV